MNGPVAIDPQLFNFGLLIIRLVFGLSVAAHGAQKLFGWFGGYGIAGTGGFMESLGFRPGKMFATASDSASSGGPCSPSDFSERLDRR
jgi:putative oxidoreductase